MTRYDQELLGIDVERHEYEHQKKTDLHHVLRLVTAFYTNPDNNCTENVSQLLKCQVSLMIFMLHPIEQ